MMIHEPINLYENTSQLVNAAVDKIVVEIFNRRSPESKDAQTIVLCGAAPLVGTTSTAIDLAIAAAATGRKVLLIDCDVRKSEKYKKLNQKTEIGLADFLLREEQPAEAGNLEAADILYDTNVENLRYIPCGSYHVNPTRIMCSSRMTPLIEQMKKQFDYIICDLPAITVVPDAQILFPVADGIVLLAALGETRKRDIKDAKKKIEPYSRKYYGMIINKITPDLYRKSVKNYDYYLQDVSGEQKLGGSPARKEYRKRKKAEGKVK